MGTLKKLEFFLNQTTQLPTLWVLIPLGMNHYFKPLKLLETHYSGTITKLNGLQIGLTTCFLVMKNA